MTSPGKNVYLISLNDSQGRMQAYRIVASTRDGGEVAARTLAGVPEGTETATSQNSGRIDAEGE